MNAIIGLDNIALRDSNISQQTRDELEKIGSSAKHLLSLINDILDMSRIESGRMVLKELEFSFREFIDQISIIINGQCEDKGLTFICNRVEPLGEYFVGDDLRLKQVIINILGNAVKFTDPPGTVTFTVEQLSMSEENTMLRFTMKDTGIGMDESFLPKLFEPFSQEDATTTNRYGGSGLGMAITKNIVELMGGEISVESRKGYGTTFCVQVPLRQVQHVEIEPAQPANAVCLTGLHVLIAEDMELNAEILMDLLEMEGITSDWAENGQIAVELFEQSEPSHYDAILMDMRMPVMDGLKATQTIRNLNRPDAASIPIIALTANAFEEDVKTCLQAGMNAHLSKPVDIDQLKLTLGRIV
jgi:CheY-like chemotaxis protein